MEGASAHEEGVQLYLELAEAAYEMTREVTAAALGDVLPYLERTRNELAPSMRAIRVRRDLVAPNPPRIRGHRPGAVLGTGSR